MKWFSAVLLTDRIAAMAEPAPTAALSVPEERRDPEAAPPNPTDFPGCRPVHIPLEDIEDYEGRLEYWEARTETAMVVAEPTTRFHEGPSHRLAKLTERLAAERGSPIDAYGTTDLVRFGAGGRPHVLMQADQILYLHPAPSDELTPKVDVDGDALPDVILEVDYSTDVRVRKLPLYEACGFPEVWVDVPDAPSPSRPKSRVSGLMIHVLEGGRFRTARTSRAFPSWTAKEIHRALNEHTMSASTEAALHRVGRALGAAEGTGPDDDRWLRRHRDEGRAEIRSETGYETVTAVLRERGIPTTPALKVRLLELGDVPVGELVRVALRCRSEAEFLELCAANERGPRPEGSDFSSS